MYGTDRTNSQDSALPPLDPIGGGSGRTSTPAATAFYRRSVAWPWMVGEGPKGILASAATFGRGLLSVSSKPGECYIGNLPIFYAVWQSPVQTKALQTPRIISNLIPSGGGNS